MPKLSIIVPVYRVEAYLPRCVDSILSQTFTDFELILVDDGSPDRCPQMCDDYARKDSRIKVIHKENGGLSDARNAGLDLASGDFIGFVDSDDWIEPAMYEKLLSAAEASQADIAVCGMLDTNENTHSVYTWQGLTEEELLTKALLLDQLFPLYFNKMRFYVTNKVYRRHVFETVRFPYGKLYEDVLIAPSILSLCQRLVLIPDYLYNYSIARPDSITNRPVSPPHFSLITAWRNFYLFYAQRKNRQQMGFTLEHYVNTYLKYSLAVQLRHPELRADFQPYRKELCLMTILLNDHICKMKKLALLLSFFAPGATLKLCRKIFPECVHKSMASNT